MSIILFALFAVMEIILTVLTCTKFREKKIWYRNRLAFSAAEIVILIIVMLTQNNKWRFAGCIFIIALRLIISGIVFLIRRNKAEGNKSIVGRIFGALTSTALIGSSLIPVFLFSGYAGLKTTGEYGVDTAEAILIDKSRLEKYEDDGSNREIPVHFYYPDGNAENCPFVLFAHGSFGYYQSNDSLYKELASNGYVVASIDHPYYAFFTEDTLGEPIIVDFDFMQTAMKMENNEMTREEGFGYEREWLEVRSADENFVLDSIKSAKADNNLDDSWYTEDSKEILDVLSMTDTGRIGLTGHSIGGAVAVKLGRERDDITAVIDIDGTMLSERVDLVDGIYMYIDEPYPVPLLALDNELHGTYYVNSPDEDIEYINKWVMDNALDGKEMSFAGTMHMDFTDLPLVAPGIAKYVLGMSTADPVEFIPQLNAAVLNYFNYYLKGEGELIAEKWN